MATKRIASQVHKQASRLIRQGYFRREPAWFQAVMEHPPLPLPAREPPSRTLFDTSPDRPLTRPAADKTIQPLEIEYVEDQVRRQFFRDHPFEAYRGTTLVEGATVESEHPIRGVEWTRLRQRGRNPSPEDAIRFAVNLYEYHREQKDPREENGVKAEKDLSWAYASAVAQYRSLRSELEVARQFALNEAQHYGTVFGPSQVDINFTKEEKAYETFQKSTLQQQNAETERKRWKAVVEREGRPDRWSKGQEYTRLWKQGVRPVYAPVLLEPEITQQGLVSPDLAARRITSSSDFLNVTGPERTKQAVQTQTQPQVEPVHA